MVKLFPGRWRDLGHEVAKFGTIGVSNLSRFLPARLQGISDEVLKFGIIGVINLVVNFAVVNLLWLTVLDDSELKAKAIATVVATTCAYFMNRHWTYRDRPKSTLRREYTLFLFFNAVGLVIEVAVVGVAKYGFGQTHILVLNLCTGIGIVLGTIFRFWAYRTHVFKLGDEGSQEPALFTAAAAFADTPDPNLSEDEFADGDDLDIESVDLATVDLESAAGSGINEDPMTEIELAELVAREQAASRTTS